MGRDGATATEWALIIALVSLAILGLIQVSGIADRGPF